jgi:hypothetical protein
LEHFLPEDISIARRARAVVSGAVALDPEKVSIRITSIVHCEVDPKFANPDLSVYLKAPFCKRLPDRVLEIVCLSVRRSRGLDRKTPLAFCVLNEVSEVDCPAVVRVDTGEFMRP